MFKLPFRPMILSAVVLMTPFLLGEKYSDFELPKSTPERQVMETETVSEDDTTRTVTAEGHTYRVAKDREIEKAGGYQGPVGMDSYIYQKFDEMDEKMDKKLQALHDRLDKIETTLSDLGEKLENLPERS